MRERENGIGERAARPPYVSTELSAVPSTLRIPLAARALGARIFPRLSVADRYAAQALAGMGDDGRAWVRDRIMVYGILKRTHAFRATAQAFLAQRPDALVVNLGCGLSQYFQWLDNGRARMLDADLPEVLAIRRRLLPVLNARHRMAEVDLTAPDWWQALGLAEGGGDALCLFLEGVLMYLQPAQVSAVLAAFGEYAPDGSILVFDAMCWLSTGHAHWLASMRRTGAEFTWGPRRQADVTAAHARLRLDDVASLLADYGPPYSVVEPMFRAWYEVPFYGVYRVGLEVGPSRVSLPAAGAGTG
ncbi:class I SAM-dependent methyltransferase [Verticiella sediminum]|uniref:Class I SAM-dependent methyltransferase n=1 Tax=Verticiella sediminum TaxID=1247510 RepID=A0A556AYY1_9BURK|nr:class I SAM-dependent methyltransferase [Verticiella sediminum]TSH98106.1 class I SAM-dependent methyltransferase [Verticiella sediminum]